MSLCTPNLLEKNQRNCWRITIRDLCESEEEIRTCLADLRLTRLSYRFDTNRDTFWFESSCRTSSRASLFSILSICRVYDAMKLMSALDRPYSISVSYPASLTWRMMIMDLKSSSRTVQFPIGITLDRQDLFRWKIYKEDCLLHCSPCCCHQGCGEWMWAWSSPDNSWEIRDYFRLWSFKVSGETRLLRHIQVPIQVPAFVPSFVITYSLTTLLLKQAHSWSLLNSSNGCAGIEIIAAPWKNDTIPSKILCDQIHVQFTRFFAPLW